MNAMLSVDVVCDTQEELEELIAANGFGEQVTVIAWTPDGPAGGNAIACLYGDSTDVYNLALMLGYEEDVIFENMMPESDDELEWMLGHPLLDDDVDVDYPDPSVQ